MLVHVAKAEHGLKHDAHDLPFRELRSSVFHKLINVLFHELEHEV